MTKKVLIKITPLEPYFFGDENTIRIGETNRYYVTSMNTPSAMTIMGMLRYTLLEQAGYLKENGYSNDEIKRNNNLIGSQSFSPEIKDYGAIKAVSPLFLMNGNDDIYIKCPLNLKLVGDKFSPIKLSETEVLTSHGKIRLPAKDEYSAKTTVGDGMYVNIENLSVENDIFSDFVKITNQKYSQEKGFMKKCFKVLKKGFCFAISVELDESATLKNTICYMGREKSSFALSVLDVSEFSLENKLADSALNSTGNFYYALSDIILNKAPDYKAFAMVNIKNLRYLNTKTDSDGKISITRGSTLHSVISAGSVFYGEPKLDIYGNDKFGINKIVNFGG